MLLAKLATRQERDWYAGAASEHGWSRDVLVHQIVTGLAERVGSAPSNFAAALPAPDSELAQQLVRDRYVFDHLALSERAAERELEQALMDRLEQTLLAFGHGMAFVGRQVRFDIDGDELVLDLLPYLYRRGQPHLRATHPSEHAASPRRCSGGRAVNGPDRTPSPGRY